MKAPSAKRAPAGEPPALEADRRGLRVTRRPWAVAPGHAGLHETLESATPVERTLVTGRCWIFSLVHPRGQVVLGGVPAEGPVAMWVPPHSLLRMRLTGALESVGLASDLPVGAEVGALPRVGPVPADAQLPPHRGGIPALLEHAVTVDPDAGVPAAARKARALLLRFVEEPNPVARAAAALRISGDGLRRMFRRHYGMGPKAYVQRVRVADGVVRLLMGADVADAAAAAGFREVGRFYEQFGQVTRQRPGAYARLR